MKPRGLSVQSCFCVEQHLECVEWRVEPVRECVE